MKPSPFITFGERPNSCAKRLEFLLNSASTIAKYWRKNRENGLMSIPEVIGGVACDNRFKISGFRAFKKVIPTRAHTAQPPLT
jgi:hypothetical protein